MTIYMATDLCCSLTDCEQQLIVALVYTYVDADLWVFRADWRVCVGNLTACAVKYSM